MAGLTREQKAAREAAAQNRDEDHDDERIVRSSGMEVRGARGTEEDPARADPTEQDDFEKLLEDEFVQTALPSPPPLPGWHQVWLTSNSQYDSIQKRQRLGYQPVRMEDHGMAFDPSNGQSLERFPGIITCNEMVLFKIEDRKYQAMMRHFHHKRPLQEEEGIVSQLRAGEVDDKGRRVAKVEGSDLDAIEQRVQQAKNQTPSFT